MFGREVSQDDFAKMVGAQPGSHLEVTDAYGNVQISVRSDEYNALRFIEEGNDGKPVLRNENISIRADLQGKGMGAKILASQVEGARAMGIARIETHAAGSPSTPGVNGYYTWPRLGYDAKFKPGQTSGLSKQFQGAKSVQALFKMPGGSEAWKAHGGSMNMSFDLKKGGKSDKILSAYLKKKASK